MPAPVLISDIPVSALMIEDLPALNCPAKTSRNFPSAASFGLRLIFALSAERTALSRRSAILRA